jgi:hypothetical protein
VQGKQERDRPCWLFVQKVISMQLAMMGVMVEQRQHGHLCLTTTITITIDFYFFANSHPSTFCQLVKSE